MIMLIPFAFMCGLCLIEIQPRYGFSAAYIFALTASMGMCAVYEYLKGECKVNKYVKLARVHHSIKNVFILLNIKVIILKRVII